MGKKKIIEKKEESIRDTEKIESAAIKVSAAKSLAKRVVTGNIYIKNSYNNTLISVTDEKGNVLAWASAGSLGFSGPKKATPFAASKIVSVLAEKLKKSGPVNIHIFVNGVGGGRDSAIRSLANQGFNILSIKDITPIPHNGPRPPKTRRV